MKTIERGELAEKLAGKYLKSQGLKLITTNYHSRFGEIDLIMLDGNVIVFVEVRYRRHQQFGGAAGSVTVAKQRKISLTANHFLQRNSKTNSLCRFDVVAVNETKTEWIKSAFDAAPGA